MFLKGSTRNRAGRLVRQSINNVAELIAAKSGRIRSLLSPETQAFLAGVERSRCKRSAENNLQVSSKAEKRVGTRSPVKSRSSS